MEEAKCNLWDPLFGPFSFINISCGKEEIDDVVDSRKNMVEVAIVIRLIHNLHKAWKRSRKPLDIAVASPYEAQVAEIQEKLRDKYRSFDGFVVNAMQIEELAAEEAEIVILSTVRSRTDSLIELPCDHRKCDLASIRARSCLWILGNELALSKSDLWKSYISDAKTSNCFFNIEANRELHEFALQVKKEFDQLDSILESDGLLFQNTRWKVFFSDSFKKSFEKIESSGMKKLVISMLVRLANGWRPKRRDVNIFCALSNHFVKNFTVKRLHLICSIDIVKESSYMQVLRVWDLLPMSDISGIVERLDNMFSTYTRDFLDRCNTICVEGDFEIPKSWEASYDIKRHKVAGQINELGALKKSKVSDNLLLMKFYSASSGLVNHLLSGCNGRESELPFELTSQEMEVIRFDKTSFLLGRSGTGKTTVLIRKLFQREQLYHLASEGFHELDGCIYKNDASGVGSTFLRQIFVTLNPRLCHVVKENLSRMKRFVYGGKTSEEEYVSDDSDCIEETLSFQAIPDSFLDISPQLYPLVITLDKFLVMLDGTVGDSFFDRISPRPRNERTSNLIALKTFIRIKEVTFQKFDKSYWPHFDKSLTKSLEASSVFTEIMSYIKGGLYGKKLSLVDYLSLSGTRVSNYNMQERKTIYDIFLLYEKKKSTNGEYDMADLVMDLHDRLKGRGYDGDKFDFVYVDEVQDLTMSQIALFRYLCTNVESGFFFSGDTAQTIAQGVGYRFEDARRLFYEEFVLKSGGKRNYEKGQKGLVTDLFHLNYNFQTHESVLRLAQSVTDLLYCFFPSTIDVLSPETSLVGGEKPVVIELSNGQNALTTIFRNDLENGGDHVDFGAEQVILVRDDNVRNGMLKYVGKHALILTIEECKGLEFQDVIIYNFLSTSPLEGQWRVIYNYMKEQNIVDRASRMSFPKFDKVKHMLLCSELKKLYVAITRTKQKLWILEDVHNFYNPLIDYWKRLQSVEVRKLDSSLVNEIKVPSSKHEWKLRGIELYNQKKYESATLCFERASVDLLKSLAEAAGLRASAWHLSSSDSKAARINLKTAAKVYSSIGKFEDSAECFYEAKEYALAGEIYMGKFGNSKLAEAGECFSLARSYARAAFAYARGKLFSNCVSACLDGKLFDEGLNYVKEWEEWENYATGHNNIHQIKATKQKISEAAALHYQKLGDKVRMMEYVKSFDSRGLMRDFLITKGFLDELLELEERWECFENVVYLAEQTGKTRLRVDLLEKANRFEEASSVILSHVYASSLWSHGSNGWPIKQFEGKKKLLERALSLAEKGSSKVLSLVSLEARILFSGDNQLANLQKLLIDSRTYQNVRGQTICAWKILDAQFTMDESEYSCSNVLVSDLTIHAKSCLSENRPSVATLVYIWDIWKKNIDRVFDYLENHNITDVYGKFCLDHLGVTKTKPSVSDETVFVLLHSDANWVRRINDQFLSRRGDSVICKSKHFFPAARSYWRSEMLSVGSKVCEKLRDLFILWNRKSLPLHCQVIPLVRLFHVAKSLVDSKFLRRGYNDRTLHRYMDRSCDWFLRDFLPLDWTEITTPLMKETRTTETFKSFVKGIGLMNHGTVEKLGNVVTMVIAFGGRLNDEIYKKLYERRAWKSHNEYYCNTDIDRVMKLHIALQQVYHTKSLVSPGGFVYLLERVMIETFSLKGCFFSTKSSFGDWLIDRDGGENALLGSESYWQPRFKSSLDKVAKIISELLCNRDDVIVWIRNFNLVGHGMFVRRLLVALCLLCINTGEYYELLSDLLDRDDITWELCEVARKLKSGCFDANVCLVAEAFAETDNPLVIASWTERRVANAIFVDLNDLDMKREQVLGMLL